MNIIEEPNIARGFDRNIDYLPMKNQIIKSIENQISDLENLNEKASKAKQRILINKIIYLMIAMIQLRNGSRITEACKALQTFLSKGTTNKVIVKIAKSEKKAYEIIKDGKSVIKNKTKARYRNIIYPNWIDFDVIEIIKANPDNCINSKRLEKRVLDYLLLNFNCNTHSLRYAFINYMLTIKKQPMATVAKLVGHCNVNQLCTYTQNKQVDAALEMDI
jgi:hypothetical protein